ncbi:hypothetical protein J2W42_006810 [Rhizobium tibeticum]|nr:hypothetical protein [Rhizobium tibeticum]
MECLEHVENTGILKGLNFAQSGALVLDQLENSIGNKRPPEESE